MPDLGNPIVSTDWLARHLDAPNLVVLDGSWHLPTEGRNPRAEYETGHIQGTRFFDIDAISDAASPLPHMLPSREAFAAHMQRLGVGDQDRIVVYDASSLGLFSAARVWWTFRVFGHDDVAVLDGGLRKWRAEGRPVTAQPPPQRAVGPFTPRLRADLVLGLDAMRTLVATGNTQIADARSAGRFAGREPEPRPGLRSGHIPGARNVPFPTLLAADGTLKSPAELRAVFEAAGIDIARPVATSCGSGVTAAVLSLALMMLGRPDNRLYDGSWSEWGQEGLGTPVETGVW